MFYSTTHNDGNFSVDDYDGPSWIDSGLDLGVVGTSVADAGYYEVDVSSIVAAEYAASDGVISFRLEMDNAAAFNGSGLNDYYSIRGGDAASAAQIPELVLNSVPEPATYGALLGMLVFSSAAFVRRK
ncbi:PEP-CTERM sorting domain-containing protein [Coraliomargarita sp. W4R53]